MSSAHALRRAQAAATLVETMVSTAIFACLCAALITGVTALQRCFANTTIYASNHAAELRISDYIARDLRESTSFTQSGSGSSLIITMTVPNFYGPDGTPRMATINPDGTVTYVDLTATPAKATSTISYYIANQTVYRRVDGVSTAIADAVQNFVIVPLDSAVDPNATTDFNLGGVNTRVAEVKIQVNFNSHYGTRQTLESFSNTTLMRNARTDTQTNLY